MTDQQSPHTSNGSKFQTAGILLMALSLFGVIPLLINVVLKTILGHPADNTTGMAIVNIGTLLSVAIGLVTGVVLLLVGNRKKQK